MDRKPKLRKSILARSAPFVLGVLLMSMVPALAGQSHRLNVDGLACPYCAYGIEKQLRAIPGVKTVSVSVKTGTVTVTMSEGTKLTRSRASQAVSNAGFTLRSFK